MVTHNPEELQLHVEHLRERDGGGRGMERGKEVEVVMESEEELGGRKVDRKHDWTFANAWALYHFTSSNLHIWTKRKLWAGWKACCVCTLALEWEMISMQQHNCASEL